MLAKLRIGITVKLFAAIFSTCMLVLGTMHWGVRFSFEHSFIDYIKKGNEQRLMMLSDALAEQYEQHGNWEFLRHNNQLVFQIMRSLEQNPDTNNQFPPHGWRTPFWIIDQQYHVMIGPRAPIPLESYRSKITTQDGHIVGWVVGSPPERLTRSADINFDQQQKRTSWIIVGLAMLLAALVTGLMSRGLLAPVKRLIEGTHRLAAGDFTSRVQANSRDELGHLGQDFNRLASTLEKNERMRREFMADISHELRTPLAILRGELEALQDGVRKLTPESIISLLGEVNTLTKLVDDVHQLSLSDEGALAYRKSATDLVPLLELTAANFNSRYQQHNLVLILKLPAQAPLFGDPDRLIQLLSNLMENSLRYTDAGGSLTVTLVSQPAQQILYFDDTAPGITDEQREQIFERFFRAESSRNRASGGSGLGLAICQNIVEAHDGRIKAEHSAAGGLRITIHLPSQKN
ncbi:two-component system sensor histidine kinase BaeS [Erwinia endophytica]|uniref:envelope stress sensor histidine kinase BaeS n=1 Tax=Erwinia endophytica TaxID=1563158 RepID=UPI001265DFBB|nr:two-component system sensor histidine kinase BaeS [Erwinia endophytica]KAB8307327.1 two-component system sensor histidine kinase BaeS [Erwinia endophytica]